MTHLFADGGRIVKSTRIDYSEHLEREGMAVVVKNMMKEQHKAMFIALRSGELDELIGFSEEDPPGSVTGTTHVLQRAADLVEAAQAERAKQASAKQPSGGASDAPKGKPEGPPAEVENRAYAVSRPAAIFTVPPPSSASIFGELGLDEKSLDDAILSYLAEDQTDSEDEEK